MDPSAGQTPRAEGPPTTFEGPIRGTAPATQGRGEGGPAAGRPPPLVAAYFLYKSYLAAPWAH